MTWLYIKGWYYDPGSPQWFRKGTVVLKNGKVVETGGSDVPHPKGPTIKGILLPMMPNAHTHLGDYSLRDRVKPGMSVEELVAPPNGLKHKLLPTIDTASSISKALYALKRAGTGYICDFREGGLGGVQDMARAMTVTGHHIKTRILGRPLSGDYDRDETDQLLKMCNGVGVSGMGDWNLDHLIKLAKHVKDAGKDFALHVSEVVREDIDQVLDLDPSFVVHMTNGTKGDFHRLSTFHIPVVCCPRSNMFYGKVPPLEEMLDAEVNICLGTDNAMMSDLSMFGELRAVRELGLEPVKAWGLIENSWKLLNQDEEMHVGAQGERLIVVQGVTEDPLELLTEVGPGANVTFIKDLDTEGM